MKTTRRNWSKDEQSIIVAVYLSMLTMQKAGHKFNKAKICRSTLPLLNDRSRGSYEMKLMNVSAALRAIDPAAEIVTGYKPYGHGQKSLTDELKAQLAQKQRITEALS